MNTPKKTLILQLKRAGDVILTTPVAALLKQCWPATKVDFLTEKAFAPLLENNPSIDTVCVYDKQAIAKTLRRIRAERYDLILDFQSSPRSAMVCLTSGSVLTAGYQVPFWGRIYKTSVPRPNGSVHVVEGKRTLLEAFSGALSTPPAPAIYLTSEERRWATDQRENLNGKKIVGLVPTHRRVSRRWHAESFATLARQFQQTGHAVWLFWGPGEQAYVQKIQEQVPGSRLTPPTTLRQLAALFSQCDVVATNDNGPMHIAAAVGTPTVTIYGPTSPHCWNPGGPRHRAIQADNLGCLGCNLNSCPFNHECMRQITPAQVFANSQELLSRGPASVLS